MLVVTLHEIGKTTSLSGIKHLLAVLCVASHKLSMVLLLLELVVKGLELLALIVVACEHVVDFLA